MEYSIVSVLTGTVLGYVAGTSLTWTSPEIGYLNSTDTGPFDGTLTTDEASWIGGVLSLGAALGPFIFGYLADKIGRKYTLLSIAVPFMISSVWTSFAKRVAEFYVARFLTGIAVGGTFSILPMYIGEMATDAHRGVLGSILNSFICFGLIFTYVVGSFVSNVLVYNLLLAGLAAGFIVLFFLFGVETPHWYIMKTNYESAKEVLIKIRKASKDATEKEFENIKHNVESEEKGTILDVFRSKGNRKALLMGSGLVFFQQASGINAVLFFAQNIFSNAGSTLDPKYCSMITGGVQFGTSFITPIVSNLCGRKLLLIFSGVGMFLSESLLGVYSIMDKSHHDAVASLSFLPILSLVLYIINYNVGFGPLPWSVIGEIFPNSVKSSASAMATSICWLTSFFITKWFGQLAQNLGQGTCFLGFAVASLMAAVFTQFVVMETRGKSLAKIQEDLNK